jgi:hypothetical protein
MSYIAGDPGPRSQLGPGPWRVVGALLLLLLVVLAAALHSVVRADDAPAPPAAAPADHALTWVRVGEQPVPVSTSHGPRITHGGLAAGFAHDELGAVIAAINISTRLTRSAGPDVYEPTARHQCVGDVAAAMATIAVQTGTATPGTTTPGAATPSEFFYRITGGDPHGDTATIALAARSPQATAQGGYAALERTVVWIHRDWRMQLPTSPPHLTDSVDGYTSLGTIHG